MSAFTLSSFMLVQNSDIWLGTSFSFAYAFKLSLSWCFIWIDLAEKELWLEVDLIIGYYSYHSFWQSVVLVNYGRIMQGIAASSFCPCSCCLYFRKIFKRD